MNKTLSDIFYKKIPKFLSVILHPLIMPTLGVYFILNSGTYLSLIPSEGKNIILLLVLSCTFGIPLAFFPFYYYRKITKTVEMNDKAERFIPLLVTSSFYYLTFFLMHRWGVPQLIQAFILASAVAVFITMIITTKWKISAHTVGIGGIVGLVFIMSVLYRIDLMAYLMLSIILSGVIGFARLSLDAHTPAQVYGGLATGFGVMVTTLLMF